MERRTEQRIASTATAVCVCFALLTIVKIFALKEPKTHLLLAFATPLLVLLPAAAEQIFRCRISLPLYLFLLFYAMGPILGESWKLYYTVGIWDKLLHVSGGIVFALVGYHLFLLLIKREDARLTAAIFGLCFSVTIAALWEFAEFFMDILFGMDMQDDIVIHGFTSYLLGSDIGITGSVSDIFHVAVNGTPLPVDGYIDIGLIDTMLDMLLESIAAAGTCILLYCDRGRHPAITFPNPQTRTGGTDP